MAVGPTLLLQSSASQRDPDRAVKAERAGKALLQPWCSHPCHKPLSLRGLEREAPPTPAPGGAAEAQGLDRRRRAGGTRSRGSHLLSPCLGEGEAGRVCLPHRGVPEGQSERHLPSSVVPEPAPPPPNHPAPPLSLCPLSDLVGRAGAGSCFYLQGNRYGGVELLPLFLRVGEAQLISTPASQDHLGSSLRARRRPPQEEPVLSQTPLSTWLPSPTPGSPSPAGQKNHPNLPWELGQAMQGRPT